MKINSNTPSFNSQISRSSKNITKIFEQLSSGKKINRASDDPAGLALANSLKSKIKGLEVESRNISSTQNNLNVSSGAISQSVDQLQNLRDLAVQSANGTLSASDRENLQQEFNQGLQNLNQLSSSTQLDLDDPDVIEKIDAAISKANSENSKIGAEQNALEYRQNAIDVERENLEAARSQAEDLDFAGASSDLAREKVIQEAQISVLKEQIKQKFAVSNQFFGNKK